VSTLNVNNINEAGGVDAVVTNGVIEKSALPSGSILQVVSVTKSDAFATGSTTYVDITGLSATITPVSASSKILVFGHIQFGHSANQEVTARLLKDAVVIGATPIVQAVVQDNFQMVGQSFNFEDSPSTTSATTYKLQTKTQSGTIRVNRRDQSDTPLSQSTITVMEVAG
jgi:hypothetical protein